MWKKEEEKKVKEGKPDYKLPHTEEEAKNLLSFFA